MNGQVKVIWRTFHTIAQSLIVHARVSESYIHFALMYTTDQIFPVLLIKYLMNEYGNLTTLLKLATDTHVILSIRCTESYCTRWQKGVKYASQSAKGFSWYLRLNSTASKRITCVSTVVQGIYYLHMMLFLMKYFLVRNNIRHELIQKQWLYVRLWYIHLVLHLQGNKLEI